MRFGRTLERAIYPPWQSQYLDYALLKKLLKEDDSAASSPSTETKESWTDQDDTRFVDELVNVQLEKVHAFHKETYEKLRARTAKCEAELDSIIVAEKGTEAQDQLQTDDDAKSTPASSSADKGKSNASGNGKKPVPSEHEKQKILNEVLTELDDISKETNELEKYSRINYTGFYKAVKKHDRKRGAGYRVKPLLNVRLSKLPFNREDYSPLLFRLSHMYSFVRQHLEGAEKRSASMNEPQNRKDEYVSHKFWVHLDNLLEVKMMIARRLPPLVYNPRSSRIAEGSQPDPSITSIYFDNPSFSLYTNKAEHSEASSLRLRWYGQLTSAPEILYEKKTVKEDDMSHESRFATKEKYIQRFINDEYHMEKQIQKLSDRAGPDSDTVQNFKKPVEEIQAFIRDNDLQPVLRANYNRTAFQIPGDDRVRISVDTNLAFIREDAIDPSNPCRDPESWHRRDIDDNGLEYPFSSIRKGEVDRFPFAVLEIKLRNDGRKKEWIQDIMNSHLVKEAPRFSKFVHGVAKLFEDNVNTLPFWLPEMETDIRRDPIQAYEEEKAKKQKEIDDEFAVGSYTKSKLSMSPLQRGGVISPANSPNIAGKVKPSPSGPQGKQRADYGTMVPSTEPNQHDQIAEEPDEDETGQHAHGQQRPAPPKTIKSFLPSFPPIGKNRSGTSRLPPGVERPSFWIKDQGPVKVEAKVWLANQRTFIKWQHIAILLATLSLGLYNAAGSHNTVARALAVVYTLIALFAGVWGYFVFMWRSRLIERRSGKDFDAVIGPVVVCVALTGGLILNFALKYQTILQEREKGYHSIAANNSGRFLVSTI